MSQFCKKYKSSSRPVLSCLTILLVLPLLIPLFLKDSAELTKICLGTSERECGQHFSSFLLLWGGGSSLLLLVLSLVGSVMRKNFMKFHFSSRFASLLRFFALLVPIFGIVYLVCIALFFDLYASKAVSVDLGKTMDISELFAVFSIREANTFTLMLVFGMILSAALIGWICSGQSESDLRKDI